MIVVRVELWHAREPGKVTELARMEIANAGERSTLNKNRGDYEVRTLFGRGKDSLDKRTTHRSARVENSPRLSLHVWNLVAEALLEMGYGVRRP